MTSAPTSATICATEPIHIPGAVQPHGVLFALSEDHVITIVSDSCAPQLGYSAASLLNTNFESLLSDLSIATFNTALDQDLATVNPVSVTVLAADALLNADLILHRSNGTLVVELEPRSDTEFSFTSSFHQVRQATLRLNQAASLPQFTEGLIAEIAAITKFDRVMVYRFDADWNGEVIAEVIVPGLNIGSFLGQHFPASDIPAQARSLYTVNWLRIIGDITYEPSPLVANMETDSAPVDLSFSVLRSVSPTHIQYLKNMGVTASMSISLVVEGRLWGLIACHHYTGPRLLPYSVRAAAEFLGQSASLLIPTKMEADQRVDRLAVHSMMDQIHAQLLDPHNDVTAALTRFRPTAADLVGASGVAISVHGTYTSVGAVPGTESLAAIARFINSVPGWPYRTSHLGQDNAEFAGLAEIASSVIAISTSPDAGSWIMWFRPEVASTVTWAGNPSEKIVTTLADGTVAVNPRVSFQSWTEIQRGIGLPWQSYEVEVADEVGRSISNQLLRESQQSMSESLEFQLALVEIEMPTINGLNFACRYEPSRGRSIGGDWYDAVAMPNGDLLLSLGDVAGHGLPAASTMAQLRSGLRAYWVDQLGPSQALSHLNSLVHQLMPTDIATGIVAAVSADQRTLRIASAGHPPLMFLRKGVAVLITPPRAPALGVSKDVPYSHIDVELEPGDLFMLYSDGLIESRERSLDEGMKIMLRTAELADATGELSDFCSVIMNNVPSKFSDDDIAILVVRIDA